jgi:hypothetical protein
MHVDAVHAPIDLRGAQLDQLQQPAFESAVANVSFHGIHRRRRTGRRARIVEPGFHLWGVRHSDFFACLHQKFTRQSKFCNRYGCMPEFHK